MDFDKQQQKAINTRKNAVVAAGAGAGKTRVLTERYLELLKEEGLGVENILVLTFTRKAAAEMYERIYTRLSGFSDQPKLAAQLGNFNAASISTLDSFCRNILQNSIHKYGFPADFSLDANQFNDQLEQHALDFCLKHKDNDVLKTFIKMAGFEQIWKDLFVSLGSQFFSLPDAVEFDLILIKQKEELERMLQIHLKELQNVSNAVAKLSSGLKAIIAGQKVCEELETFINENDDYTVIAAYFSRSDVKLKKTFGTSRTDEVSLMKEYADIFNEAADRVYKAAEMLSSWDKYCSMFDLTSEWQDVVFHLKRENAVLGFSDVVSICVDILKTDLTLRQHFKKQFRYIMIDEFQDNNEEQKNLLYLLAESDEILKEGIPSSGDLHPGKLFFVGDEKQSIYRFRGADVSVFKQLQEELTKSGGDYITLETNYRSEPVLISFFNQLFLGVMKNAEHNYEAEYAPLGDRGISKANPVNIELWVKPFEGKSDSDVPGSDEAEAFAAASYIRDAVENKKLELEEGRTADYGDFAILMRSTSNQRLYEKMLRRQMVPFTTVGTRSLFLDAPVFDIYNALQCALFPEDELAAAAFLRSPFAGLSDSAVTQFVLMKKSIFTEDIVLSMDDEDRKRFEKAMELLVVLQGRIDVNTIAEVLFYLWYEAGYLYHVLSHSYAHNFTEFYDYLISIAVSFDMEQKNCADFLKFIRANLGKYEKLDEYSVLQDAKGVQLLTIHKSKGLEFPVVILANCGNMQRGEKTRPWYSSEKWGLTFNFIENKRGKGKYVNPFFQAGKEEAEDKELAELKRLLYVACTRAESHLIMSGCENSGNRSSEKVLLNMIRSAVEFSDIKEIKMKIIPDIRDTDLLSASARCADPEKMLALYRQKEEVIPLAVRSVYSATELEETAGEKGIFIKELPEISIDSLLSELNLETEFGSLCHSFIEDQIKGDKAKFSDRLPVSFPEKEHSKILNEVKQLASNFFRSDLGQRILKTHEAESEKSFLLGIDAGRNILINGIIDLFAVDAQGLFLIDFKTDKMVFEESYFLQLSLYKHAIQQIYGKEPECYIFYLREGEARRIKPYNSSRLQSLIRKGLDEDL